VNKGSYVFNTFTVFLGQQHIQFAIHQFIHPNLCLI